ncbi:MAG: hypothetical protein LHW64_11795, partial [Candidatus Cloacimonetes bacterium]|nr:hypothetical protein [Candidatus Cloacimonadota bacterium]MDY0230762.1 hypothetical protein [Candidatus Cloacimonadaceae bacterium]
MVECDWETSSRLRGGAVVLIPRHRQSKNKQIGRSENSLSANSLVNKAMKKLLQKMNEPEFYETFN